MRGIAIGQSEDIQRVTMHVDGAQLVVAAGAHIGNRYESNFDVLHVDTDLPLVVVADGMGGGSGSAVAGSTAVDVFVGEVVAARKPLDAGSLRTAVAGA